MGMVKELGDMRGVSPQAVFIFKPKWRGLKQQLPFPVEHEVRRGLYCVGFLFS